MCAHALPAGFDPGVLGEIFPVVKEAGFLDRDSEKAAFHQELVRDPRDILLEKPHYGAFYDTPLELLLRRRSIDTIMITGIETNVCCEKTARADDVLELDELWSFVSSKDNQRWVWIALCRRTRQVVAFFVGDRSEASCRQLWERLPKAYRRCRTFSDFWDAYQKVFATGKHQSVGKDSGETNHVERWNNTLRQRLARFVRKTLSFSKNDFYHELVWRLFIIRYNIECIS